jgi:hypothetical protein
MLIADNNTDQRLYRLAQGRRSEPTPPGGWFYADYWVESRTAPARLWP